MKIKTIFIALLLPAAAAANGENDALTPIIDEIAANNPELQSLRASQAAEILQRRADNMLEATEAGFDMKWSQFDRSDTKTGFEITQGFDWPGAYGARRNATRACERAFEAQCREAQRQLRISARTLLLEVVDANLRCSLLSRMVQNLDTLHSTLHSLLETRQVTELDHRKTALEEIAVKQQLADAESTRADVLARLAALNGGTLPASVADLCEYPADALLPLDHYLAQPVSAAESALFEAESARLDSRAERLALLPGFTVGYGFEREDNTFFHGFTLGLRLPEYSAAKRSAAASLRAQAADQLAEQARSERQQEIIATHRQAEICAGLLADYRTALGSNYLQVLQRCLQAGQITYADYFTELNFYLSAVLDYYTQQLAYHRLLTQLIN